MTCYERLRNNKDKKDYHNLQAYFHAVDNNTVEQYHTRRGRGDKDKKLY